MVPVSLAELLLLFRIGAAGARRRPPWVPGATPRRRRWLPWAQRPTGNRSPPTPGLWQDGGSLHTGWMVSCWAMLRSCPGCTAPRVRSVPWDAAVPLVPRRVLAASVPVGLLPVEEDRVVPIVALQCCFVSFAIEMHCGLPLPQHPFLHCAVPLRPPWTLRTRSSCPRVGGGASGGRGRVEVAGGAVRSGGTSGGGAVRAAPPHAYGVTVS